MQGGWDGESFHQAALPRDPPGYNHVSRKSQFSSRPPLTWLHTGVSREPAECLCPGPALSPMSLVSVLLRRVSHRAGADPSGSHSEEGGSVGCKAAAPGGRSTGGQVLGSQGHRERILCVSTRGSPSPPTLLPRQLHWPPGAGPAQIQLRPTCSCSHRCQGRDVGLQPVVSSCSAKAQPLCQPHTVLCAYLPSPELVRHSDTVTIIHITEMGDQGSGPGPRPPSVCPFSHRLCPARP